MVGDLCADPFRRRIWRGFDLKSNQRKRGEDTGPVQLIVAANLTCFAMLAFHHLPPLPPCKGKEKGEKFMNKKERETQTKKREERWRMLRLERVYLSRV